MTHKERMDKLKEEDPILYYELTSNPTGAEGDDGCMTGILIILVVSFLIAIFAGNILL